MYLEFILKDLFDVLLLGFILYRVILLFAETRALRLAYGIVFLILAAFVAKKFNFTGLMGLFGYFDPVTIGVVILAILFAPEIREALARLGTGARARFREQREAERKVIEEVVKACHSMAKKKMGALIVLEREDGLRDYTRSGVTLDSDVSALLLESIFHPSSPLHDGAVVIKGNRLIAAKCILPLSESLELKREGVGTRHRAALGLAELRDAAVLAVSEERGTISLAEGGKMLKYVDEGRLSNELVALFAAGMKKAQRRARFDLRKALFANVHWKIAALFLSLLIWGSRRQEIPVVTRVMFDPESSYPQNLRDVKDGDRLVLEPKEMGSRRLTLEGENWRLYRIIFGLLDDPEYLAGKIRISDGAPRDPASSDVPKHRDLLVRHHEKDKLVQVKDKVKIHHLRRDAQIGIRGVRRSCGETHQSTEDPKPLYLHVAEVAAIPKAEVRVRVFGSRRLPRDYESRDAVIDFKRPDDPLICLRRDLTEVKGLLGECETDPQIDIAGATETREFEGVKLILPAKIRFIPWNEKGDVIRRIVVPIRAGEPPPVVAAAERMRDEAREDAEAREAKVKEEVEEIGRLLELHKKGEGEFYLALDLSRLELASKTLRDCEKEITRAGERLAEVEGQKEGEDKEHAEILKGIRRDAARHLRRYIDSTTTWKEELELWVATLDAELQPVKETRQDVLDKQEESRKADEALVVAREMAENRSETKAYADLIRDLAARKKGLQDLPAGPVARLAGMASFFPSEVHAEAWRALQKGLRDQAGTAREIQRQAVIVSQREAERQQARFPALADQRLLFAQEQLTLLLKRLEIAGQETAVASLNCDEALDKAKDERALMEQKLGTLRAGLAEAKPSEADAVERLKELIAGGLDAALKQARDAREKAQNDLDAVRSDLAELSADKTPEEEAGKLTGEEEGPAGKGETVSETVGRLLKNREIGKHLKWIVKRFREDEREVMRELEKRLKERGMVLGKEAGLMEQAMDLAKEHLARYEKTASPRPPPEEAEGDGPPPAPGPPAPDPPSEAERPANPPR